MACARQQVRRNPRVSFSHIWVAGAAAWRVKPIDYTRSFLGFYAFIFQRVRFCSPRRCSGKGQGIFENGIDAPGAVVWRLSHLVIRFDATPVLLPSNRDEVSG